VCTNLLAPRVLHSGLAWVLFAYLQVRLCSIWFATLTEWASGAVGVVPHQWGSAYHSPPVVHCDDDRFRSLWGQDIACTTPPSFCSAEFLNGFFRYMKERFRSTPYRLLLWQEVHWIFGCLNCWKKRRWFITQALAHNSSMNSYLSSSFFYLNPNERRLEANLPDTVIEDIKIRLCRIKSVSGMLQWLLIGGVLTICLIIPNRTRGGRRFHFISPQQWGSSTHSSHYSGRCWRGLIPSILYLGLFSVGTFWRKWRRRDIGQPGSGVHQDLSHRLSMRAGSKYSHCRRCVCILFGLSLTYTFIFLRYSNAPRNEGQDS